MFGNPERFRTVSYNPTRHRKGAGGHVESYFLRANHPTERRAFWLKATILERLDGQAVAECWFAIFGPGRARGAKVTVPVDEARFEGDPLEIRIGDCSFSLGRDGGSAKGRLDTKPRLSWDLSWKRPPGLLAEPLCPYPSRRMVDGPFPKSKLLTPAPVLRFEGTVQEGKEKVEVANWLGMQGHNWGNEHAREYVWGQCIFAGPLGEAEGMVEGFSGRIRLGGLTTPLLSALVVRRGDREWRFNRIFDIWNHEVRIGDMRWDLTIHNRHGRVHLGMEADPAEIACLGYYNPDDALAYCLNSKMARVELECEPSDAPPFSFRAEHAGALEFLRRTPDPRFPNPV